MKSPPLKGIYPEGTAQKLWLKWRQFKQATHRHGCSKSNPTRQTFSTGVCAHHGFSHGGHRDLCHHRQQFWIQWQLSGQLGENVFDRLPGRSASHLHACADRTEAYVSTIGLIATKRELNANKNSL